MAKKKKKKTLPWFICHFRSESHSMIQCVFREGKVGGSVGVWVGDV